MTLEEMTIGIDIAKFNFVVAMHNQKELGIQK